MGPPATSSVVGVEHPHAAPVAEVVEGLESDAMFGLHPTEADRRLTIDGPNELDQSTGVPWYRLIAHNLTNPLVVLLLIAMGISVVSWTLSDEQGLPVDAIAIGAIILINATIEALQSRRAENAVAALAAMTATQAKVVRDGVHLRLPAREVVVGDLVVLAEGDAVPADARLVDCRSLVALEASLTGESAPVRKQLDPTGERVALGDRTSMVYAGTAAASGHGRAVVTATGMDTEIGHIASLLEETERQPTALEREIRSVGRFLGVAVVIIAAIVVTTILLLSEVDSAADVVEVLLIGVSLAVAAVPEGLPAVLSIVLAIGVQRMARRNALVKRLASAETLGSATVICTDKTGTLTRSEMTLRAIVTDTGIHDVSGAGFARHAVPLVDGNPAAAGLLEAVTRVLEAGSLASNAAVQDFDDRWHSVGDPTEAAIVMAAAKFDALDGARARFETIDELAFTSDRMRMSVLTEDSTDPHHAATLFTKGAPDRLLDVCSHERLGDQTVELDADRRQWWEDQIGALAQRSMRTLGVASRPHPGRTIDATSETGLELQGVVGIVDPPRDEAAPSVAAAHAAGIRVIMITGDHPATAGRIAEEVGIVEADAAVVAGVELDALDDASLARVVGHTNVFARVAPAQKLRLVQALQRRDEVVAMTGDGVNDAPALKAADIGTAMGLAGTDVAREAADIVLMDDNFSTIVAAVAEGRSIFHNIQSFLRYLLSSNVGEVMTMFFGVLLAGLLSFDAPGETVLAPLTATQILWINLLTDTGPALALGVDPGDPLQMHQGPRRTHSKVIDAVMWRGIGVVGLTMAVATLLMFDAHRPGGLIEGSSDPTTARTAAFTVLVLAQLFNCFNSRSDYVSAAHRWAANRWLLVAIAGSLALQILVVYLPGLNSAFDTAPLTLGDWLWCTALASSVLWVMEIRKFVVRRRHEVTLFPSGPARRGVR